MRNANWKHDERLKETLEEYSRQGLQRTEILSFVTRDFGDYTWSLRTLDRRMREFGIYIERIKQSLKKILELLCKKN